MEKMATSVIPNKVLSLSPMRRKASLEREWILMAS